jgi:DNA polymerase-3 subunit gamma/tau
MRGATAPRLHLELVCARALLPGADEDAARGLGARMDRLERRFAIGPATERTTAGTTEPARPEPAPAAPANPAAEAAPEQAADTTAEVSGPTDERLAPTPAGSEGALDLHAVRGLWPTVLDQVKQRRRVTWLLLYDKVQVLGVGEKSLTIGFPDAGSVKGFTAGGHDEVLRLAIIDVVGADWTIDPVHQPAAAATRSAQPAAPAEDAPAPGSAGRRGQGRSAPAPQAEEHPGEGDDVDDDLSGADLVMRELGGQVIAEHGTAEHVRDQRGGT